MLKKTVMKTETEVVEEKSSKSRENNIPVGQYPVAMLTTTNFDRPKCSDCFNWTRVFTNFLESCFHR